MLFLLDALKPGADAAPYTPEGLTLGEVFAQGGKWFLLGIMTVFAVLGIIWAAIEIFHRLCNAIPAKKEDADTIVSAPKSAPASPAPAVTAPVAVATAGDAEIVAAIIAAIEAAKAEMPNGKFRVVSFRKK